MKTLDLMNICQCRLFGYVKTIKMWGINGNHFIHYRLALFFQLLLQCLQGGSVFKSCFFLLLPHFSHRLVHRNLRLSFFPIVYSYMYFLFKSGMDISKSLSFLQLGTLLFKSWG